MCQNWMVSKNTSQCFWRAGMMMLLMPSCWRPLFVLHSERSCNPEMGNRKSELQALKRNKSGTAWDLATANNAFHNHLAHQSRGVNTCECSVVEMRQDCKIFHLNPCIVKWLLHLVAGQMPAYYLLCPGDVKEPHACIASGYLKLMSSIPESWHKKSEAIA